MTGSKGNISDNLKKHTDSKGLKRRYIDRFHELMVKAVVNEHPRSVLDAGCGEGFFIQELLNADISEVNGFDLSETAIEVARANIGEKRIYLRTGDASTINYNGKTFDVVCCLEVLEHLTDPRRALKNLASLTGKTLFVSVPNEPLFCLGNLLAGKNIKRLGNDLDHKHLWTGSSFRRFVRNALVNAFTIERLNPAIFPWTMIKCTRRFT